MIKRNLDETVFYFAYGSNMNPERMLERGAEFTHRQKHTLPGYSLKFNKVSSKVPGSGSANIVPDQNGTVEGILYEITVRNLYNLDEYEGYPVQYTRIRIEVEINAATEIAKAYIAMPDRVGEGLRPAKSYLGHLLAAKEDLSAEYYDFLINVETFD